ncbi:MAG: hypothetical protein WC982_09630 [Advenella sp.]
MTTIKLRTTDKSDGMFQLQPRDLPAGMNADGTEATYVISNVPGNTTTAQTINRANKAVFIGCYKADYDQLKPGAIIRERHQN